MFKAIAIMLPVVAALLLLGIMFALGGDIAAKYADVSAEPDYKELVGTCYELRVPMHLSGVNAPPGYGKTIDFYTVNPARPSWSGPELITRRTLSPGTLVTVRSVRRCTNCLFDTRVEALVQIDGVDIDSRFLVSISLDYLAPEFALKHGKQAEPVATARRTGRGQLWGE